jgi:hypothetical protein
LPVLFVAISFLCHSARRQASAYQVRQVLNHSAQVSKDSPVLTGAPTGSEILGPARAVSGCKGLPPFGMKSSDRTRQAPASLPGRLERIFQALEVRDHLIKAR